MAEPKPKRARPARPRPVRQFAYEPEVIVADAGAGAGAFERIRAHPQLRSTFATAPWPAELPGVFPLKTGSVMLSIFAEGVVRRLGSMPLLAIRRTSRGLRDAVDANAAMSKRRIVNVLRNGCNALAVKWAVNMVQMDPETYVFSAYGTDGIGDFFDAMILAGAAGANVVSAVLRRVCAEAGVLPRHAISALYNTTAFDASERFASDRHPTERLDVYAPMPWRRGTRHIQFPTSATGAMAYFAHGGVDHFDMSADAMPELYTSPEMVQLCLAVPDGYERNVEIWMQMQALTLLFKADTVDQMLVVIARMRMLPPSADELFLHRTAPDTPLAFRAFARLLMLTGGLRADDTQPIILTRNPQRLIDMIDVGAVSSARITKFVGQCLHDLLPSTCAEILAAAEAPRSRSVQCLCAREGVCRLYTAITEAAGRLYERRGGPGHPQLSMSDVSRAHSVRSITLIFDRARGPNGDAWRCCPAWNGFAEAVLAHATAFCDWDLAQSALEALCLSEGTHAMLEDRVAAAYVCSPKVSVNFDVDVQLMAGLATALYDNPLAFKNFLTKAPGCTRAIIASMYATDRFAFEVLTLTRVGWPTCQRSTHALVSLALFEYVIGSASACQPSWHMRLLKRRALRWAALAQRMLHVKPAVGHDADSAAHLDLMGRATTLSIAASVAFEVSESTSVARARACAKHLLAHFAKSTSTDMCFVEFPRACAGASQRCTHILAQDYTAFAHGAELLLTRHACKLDDMVYTVGGRGAIGLSGFFPVSAHVNTAFQYAIFMRGALGAYPPSDHFKLIEGVLDAATALERVSYAMRLNYIWPADLHPPTESPLGALADIGSRGTLREHRMLALGVLPPYSVVMPWRR